ncbi:(Fe-S)-binding protein [Desulfosporosinus sp. FKA]|uniref:(Fe-S)-binding protein n=1 Tax=Desulfosporosinus sp. FKA TaxID=1969834 RepID=UPI000B49A410|nr:(Fe-S)-binding protein [Desulfosporosinus sp. FKA]
MSLGLIQEYEMKLSPPGCHPGANWYRVFIAMVNDISEVFPYLNADLKGLVDYDHQSKILLWSPGGKEKIEKIYAFRAHEIGITPISDRDEAKEFTGKIIDIVNDVWNRRGEIQPKFEGNRPLPSALDIYKLLPRTNCKECGFLTCMAFAVALRNDFNTLSLCTYMPEDAFLKLVSQEQ